MDNIGDKFYSKMIVGTEKGSNDILITLNPVFTETIELISFSNEKIPLEIYSLQGQFIKQFMAHEGNNTLYLTSLHSGFYLLQYNTTTIKLIKY